MDSPDVAAKIAAVDAAQTKFDKVKSDILGGIAVKHNVLNLVVSASGLLELEHSENPQLTPLKQNLTK